MDDIELRCAKGEPEGSFHYHFTLEKLVECWGMTTFMVYGIDPYAAPEAPATGTLAPVSPAPVGPSTPGRFDPTPIDTRPELPRGKDPSFYAFVDSVEKALHPDNIAATASDPDTFLVRAIGGRYRLFVDDDKELARIYLARLFSEAAKAKDYTKGKAVFSIQHKLTEIDKGAAPAPEPAKPAWMSPDAPWRKKEPKPGQLDEVKRRGGSVEKARGMTRGECSDYIDGLKSGRIEPEPDAPAEDRGPDPDEFVAIRKTKVPVELLALVRDGRYATQANEGSPINFIRITRPKLGRYAGCTKVQRQEGDRLVDSFIVWKNGEVSVYKAGIEDPILMVIADQHGAARRYAQEKRKCCKCGTPLTDDRSRKYGIGPECEKYWPWMITLVDDEEEIRRSA